MYFILYHLQELLTRANGLPIDQWTFNDCLKIITSQNMLYYIFQESLKQASCPYLTCFRMGDYF